MSTPFPSTNFNSLPSVIVTSVPSPSSITNPEPIVLFVVIEPPNDVAEPSIVILLFANLPFAIDPANLPFAIDPANISFVTELFGNFTFLFVLALSLSDNSKSPSSSIENFVEPTNILPLDTYICLQLFDALPKSYVLFAEGIIWPVISKLPPAKVNLFEACVSVISPLLKFMTEPLAKNKSDHIKDDVPNATPSLVTGANTFAAIFISSTSAILKITSSSVVAKSIKLWESLPIFKPAL